MRQRPPWRRKLTRFPIVQRRLRALLIMRRKPTRFPIVRRRLRPLLIMQHKPTRLLTLLRSPKLLHTLSRKAR